MSEPTEPPKPRPKRIELTFIHRDADDGYWIDVEIDGAPYSQVGPFATATERQRATDDLLNMLPQVH